MPVTHEEMIDAILRPIEDALEGEGITPEYLAKKLKKELNAKEVKTFFDQKTGQVVYSKKMIAWQIRQKAREDVHKLLGHYPAEKHELTGEDGQPIRVDLRGQMNLTALKNAIKRDQETR